MPILLNKISTKGGRGGQKSPKSCLRRIRMPPYGLCKLILKYFSEKLCMSLEIFWSKPWNCYRMNKMTIYQKVSLDFKSKKRWINWKISWKLLVVKIFENSKKWWDFFKKICITYLPAYLYIKKINLSTYVHLPNLFSA